MCTDHPGAAPNHTLSIARGYCTRPPGVSFSPCDTVSLRPAVGRPAQEGTAVFRPRLNQNPHPPRGKLILSHTTGQGPQGVSYLLLKLTHRHSENRCSSLSNLSVTCQHQGRCSVLPVGVSPPPPGLPHTQLCRCLRPCPPGWAVWMMPDPWRAAHTDFGAVQTWAGLSGHHSHAEQLWGNSQCLNQLSSSAQWSDKHDPLPPEWPEAPRTGWWKHPVSGLAQPWDGTHWRPTLGSHAAVQSPHLTTVLSPLWNFL